VADRRTEKKRHAIDAVLFSSTNFGLSDPFIKLSLTTKVRLADTFMSQDNLPALFLFGDSRGPPSVETDESAYFASVHTSADAAVQLTKHTYKVVNVYTGPGRGGSANQSRSTRLRVDRASGSVLCTR
jgi:hypothetical protein